MDIGKIRPRDGWVLVLADQRQEKTAGGILLPGTETGSEKVGQGAGLLIAVGSGVKNKALGIEKGVRIVYRGYLKHAHRLDTDEKWSDGETKFYFLMSSDDIYGVVAPGVDVSIYSGRPQTPERSNG